MEVTSKYRPTEDRSYPYTKLRLILNFVVLEKDLLACEKQFQSELIPK